MAKYLCEIRSDNAEFQQLFSLKAVRKRYATYGGCYRYVLPSSARMDSAREDFLRLWFNIGRVALACTPMQLEEDQDIRVQYSVSKTPFTRAELRLYGKEIKKPVAARLWQARHDDLRFVLGACQYLLPERAPVALQAIAPMRFGESFPRWRASLKQDPTASTSITSTCFDNGSACRARTRCVCAECRCHIASNDGETFTAWRQPAMAGRTAIAAEIIAQYPSIIVNTAVSVLE